MAAMMDSCAPGVRPVMRWWCAGASWLSQAPCSGEQHRMCSLVCSHHHRIGEFDHLHHRCHVVSRGAMGNSYCCWYSSVFSYSRYCDNTEELLGAKLNTILLASLWIFKGSFSNSLVGGRPDGLGACDPGSQTLLLCSCAEPLNKCSSAVLWKVKLNYEKFLSSSIISVSWVFFLVWVLMCIDRHTHSMYNVNE